jgi:glycosyltransferase involved in cell wall biosynthesis
MDSGTRAMKGRIFIMAGVSPDRRGGVERTVLEMTKKLEMAGYIVQTFHAGNSVPGSLNGPRRGLTRLLSDALAGYHIGNAAKKELSGEVVAVISHGPVGWYPFHIRNSSTKRIHFYHGTYWGVAEAIRPYISLRGYLFLKWWAAMVLERLSGYGKLILCNSDQTKAEIEKLFHYHCSTVWLPMDTDGFSPRESQDCRRTLGLPEDKPIGLFAGSLEPHKGFRIVRKLIEMFPDVFWVLLIRGRPPFDLPPYPNVKLLGEINDAKLRLVYSSASFLICPSRYEPFGYVVAEALACGTPVISSPTGASQLFMSDPPLDQFLVSGPDDLDGFRRAVSRLVEAPEYYRRVVLQKVRPELEAVMSSESWWKRVSEVTGL